MTLFRFCQCAGLKDFRAIGPCRSFLLRFPTWSVTARVASRSRGHRLERSVAKHSVRWDRFHRPEFRFATGAPSKSESDGKPVYPGRPPVVVARVRPIRSVTIEGRIEGLVAPSDFSAAVQAQWCHGANIAVG
jgi:hypothetical protein